MISSLVDSFVQIALDIIGSLGYLGIFILMTIESTIIPFPAELILIPAGALVAQGTFAWPLVLIAAILGSVAGALINYAAAYHLGRRPVNLIIRKYGKFLLLDESVLLKTESYFDKHGHITTLLGRLIPGVRSFISLPAGFARMNLIEFSLFTAIGAGIWSAFLIGIGYFLGNNLESITSRLDNLSFTLTGLAILIGCIYYLKRRSGRVR